MIDAMAALSVRVDDEPARRAARSIARRLGAAVRGRGRGTLAVSGGSTAPPMLAALAAAELPWDRIGVWQVDERVAPDGDPDRNAGQLAGVPGRAPPDAGHRAGPRTRCGGVRGRLPERFDVVHLGMGADGHTASWPPGDPVIDSTHPVDLSGVYQGRIRMTLTPPVVDAARGRVVLITGADKADAVARLAGGRRRRAADRPCAPVRHRRRARPARRLPARGDDARLGRSVWRGAYPQQALR